MLWSVRLRPPPCDATRGVAGDGRGRRLVLAQAVRLLRPQPLARRAAEPTEAPRRGVSLMRADPIGDRGWRMPAEWEPHERCLMAWPTRADSGARTSRKQSASSPPPSTHRPFEPLTLVVTPGPGSRDARRLSGSRRHRRDSDRRLRRFANGPIMVLVDPSGQRRASTSVFNSWGERFLPYDEDAAVSKAIS